MSLVNDLLELFDMIGMIEPDFDRAEFLKNRLRQFIYNTELLNGQKN